MTAGCLFEIVSASLVGDRPRWWCLSISEAETLVRSAGTVLTVGDLHTEPCPDPQYSWAIVRVALLDGDPSLAHDAHALIGRTKLMTPGPWSVNKCDDDAGLISYQLQATNREADGLVVGYCDEADDVGPARANAHGLVALRNGVEGVLTRALAELARLRDELRARGGR